MERVAGDLRVSYRVHCCCPHSGRHGPHWRAPGCPRRVWSGRHPGLSRMLGSGVQREANTSPHFTNTPGEEEEHRGGKREEREEKHYRAEDTVG